MHTATALLPTLSSGALIGLVLGLIGGGGSILAVPLLVYFVGVSSAHAAIGTAAIAVALSAAVSLVGHWRSGTVKWPCALVFAASGIVGTVIGAQFGKAVAGPRLLELFGALMLVVGALMLRKRRTPARPDVRLTIESARELLPRLIPIGLAVGILAGFFGIGGGFLIVPGLMLATAMPLTYAIGTSLVAVTAFGATTASSYALSGYVDWEIAALLVAGGAVGTTLGIRAGRHLAGHKRALDVGFAIVVMGVGVYLVAQST